MAKINGSAENLITDYIQSLPPFSKEICLRLREIILSSSDQIQEDWKWGPNYNANGMIVGYGGFQKHVSLHFFRGTELSDKHGLFNHCVDSISSRSIKYTSVEEIDEKKLSDYIREAVRLNQSTPNKKKETQKAVIPKILREALKGNPEAKKNFEAMSAYKQKEFIEQVETAKRPETLAKRMEKIMPLLEAGIGWNDKYRKS